MANRGMESLPEKLEPALERVHGYWQGLKRGENAIPFSDDVRFSARARLAQDVFLVEVFEDPLRFRLEFIGDDILERYGGETVRGKFSDEIDLRPPLDQLTAQCRASVERRVPTYFTSAVPGVSSSYARLVLPLWGNGHIDTLLGAVTPSATRQAVRPGTAHCDGGHVPESGR